MGEYGLKIKNIQAASIYEVNAGVRDQLDQKDALLTNSLFLDFLLQNGLEVWKGESTRGIVCLEFGYGTRSYDQEVAHLNKILKDVDTDERRKRIENLIMIAEQNHNKYVKISKQDLRKMYYKDGVEIRYDTHDKSGKIIRSETIKYRFLYRTPGKAKKGTCYFCSEAIYDKAHEFLYMGYELPKDNAMLVEMGAYSSLVTSSIVGRIKIEPENIVIMDDVEVPFVRDAISIEVNEKNQCVAVPRKDYQVKSTLFDGQGLIDSSIFPQWGEGYLLLRHHMTKCAAFCTNIQLYFKDFCEENDIDYNTFTIKDTWGNEHLAKDVKLLTTTNAAKFMKFGISYEYWSDWVRKNGCLFGIVKTAHESKLGAVQQMSYQMVNTLGMDTMYSVLIPTADYVRRLQTDDKEFLRYLRRTQNFSNDHEVLIALAEHNPDFVRSEYFKERKSLILRGYTRNLKTGKLLQNADNLVIVGSPYAMLMHSVGLDARDDPTFEQEDGVIQCYTERFDDGEYLADFRSPHNSCNGIGYGHNHYHQYFSKYFKFGKQIIAVNLNGTDFQDRHNGSDQDSDSVFVTNQPDIVAHAAFCYKQYPTIVNNIPKETKSYQNTPESMATIDNILASSQLNIGQSSNLAAIALAYSYTYQDQKYKDFVCILSVLAQAAIDNSKKTFVVDISSEIKRIKNEMNIKELGYPAFWKCIHPEYKGYINWNLKCPMNEVAQFKLSNLKRSQIIPNKQFFIKHKLTEGRRKCRRVENLIQKYSLRLAEYNTGDEHEYEDYILLMNEFNELVNDIKQIYISNNYLGLMSWLIDRCLQISTGTSSHVAQSKSQLDKNRSLLLKTLYTVSPKQFMQCFKSQRVQS